MMEAIELHTVTTLRARRAFAHFPWRVYQGDPNWVPPLISERLEYLDPSRGIYYKQADIALFMARRGREVLGTIATFVDHARVEHMGRAEGGFGFFEVVKEYAVAERLLDACCEWLRARGMVSLCGPTNFGDFDSPGVLIAGADCPPAMLEAHTPPYYQDFMERYGMEKDHDLYAWRASFEQIGEDLQGVPADMVRVAEVARRMSNLTIRRIRPQDWDQEVALVLRLFNATLSHLPEFVPLSEAEFGRLSDQMRPFMDMDLVLFAEIEGQPIGFCTLIPDVNRVLIRLDGRLFPFNWLKIGRYIREIDVVSFKLMGVLEEYRRRGIDALLYLEALKAAAAKGYKWLDGSLTSETNAMINLIAGRLGAEPYKHYRLYRMEL